MIINRSLFFIEVTKSVQLRVGNCDCANKEECTEHQNAGLKDLKITAFFKKIYGDETTPSVKTIDVKGVPNNIQYNATVDLEPGTWILQIKGGIHFFPRWIGPLFHEYIFIGRILCFLRIGS